MFESSDLKPRLSKADLLKIGLFSLAAVELAAAGCGTPVAAKPKPTAVPVTSKTEVPIPTPTVSPEYAAAQNNPVCGHLKKGLGIRVEVAGFAHQESLADGTLQYGPNLNGKDGGGLLLDLKPGVFNGRTDPYSITAHNDDGTSTTALLEVVPENGMHYQSELLNSNGSTIDKQDCLAPVTSLSSAFRIYNFWTGVKQTLLTLAER